jgi:hypothetical protein
MLLYDKTKRLGKAQRMVVGLQTLTEGLLSFLETITRAALFLVPENVCTEKI